MRPISAANIPPALTTTSASTGPTRYARRERAPAAASTSMPVTRVCVNTRQPPSRAPSSERHREQRRIEIAVVGQIGGAAHAVGAISGNSSRASSARDSSSGSPNVLAHATWRRTSCSRSGVQARRMPPHWTQPQSSSRRARPVHHHAGSATRSSAAGRRVPRSGRSIRSSARCGRAGPRRARRASPDGGRSTAPPTPPPMITTRARSGSSRGRQRISAPCRESHSRSGIRSRTLQPLEVIAGVALEVEVERRDLALHDAPGGFAGVGEHAHQLQRGALAVRRRSPW